MLIFSSYKLCKIKEDTICSLREHHKYTIFSYFPNIMENEVEMQLEIHTSLQLL